MVNINLVPEKIRSAESLRLIIIVGAASLALPALFWGYRYQGKRAELYVVERDLKSLQAELDAPDLRQVVQDVEQFTTDQANLESKRSIVDLLRKRQVQLVKLLDMIPDIFTGNARLTSLAVTDDRGAKKVVMACLFRTSDSIPIVYENLEASPMVGKLEMAGPPTDQPATTTAPEMLAATFNFELQDLP